MRRRSTTDLSFALAALLAVTAGCQLLVDLDGLENMKCGPKEKPCGDRCVANDNITTGCNDPGCFPCAPTHAVAICSQTLHCSFDRTSCLPGWDHCDGPDNGCETDIVHNPLHCGDCNTVCPRPENGTAGCSEGKCVISGCIEGYEDCNHDPKDGCEHKIWTNEECLTCGLPCPEGTTCDQGVCI
jgi:hypothetical protein